MVLMTEGGGKPKNKSTQLTTPGDTSGEATGTSDYQKGLTNGSTATTGTSAYVASLYSPSQIAGYYYLNSNDEPIALEMRLRSFRNAYAQTGNADLEQYVLDYEMGFSGFNLGGRKDPYANRTFNQADPKHPMGLRPGFFASMEKADQGSGKRTIQGLLEYARNMKGDDMATLQKLLLESGYMNPKVYKQSSLLQPGVYDIYTQEAWTTLLKDAVMAGDDDVSRTLQRRKEAIDGMGGLSVWIGANEPERDPFVARLTAKEDIVGTGEQVANEMIGRGGSGFAEGLVGGYNATEEAAQRAAYDAQPSGGTVTEAPSVQGYAEEQLKKTHGTEVGAYSGLGAFNTILQDLGLAG